MPNVSPSQPPLITNFVVRTVVYVSYSLEPFLEVRPPTLRNSPIEVEFSMRVVDINSINVEDMDFRIDMFLSQEWVDARIKIPEDMFEIGDDAVTLPAQSFDNLWQPDLYFLNSKVVGKPF